MSDSTEVEEERDDERRIPIRRRWHAPEFVSTDLALTDTQGNGGTDHGPMMSAS